MLAPKFWMKVQIQNIMQLVRMNMQRDGYLVPTMILHKGEDVNVIALNFTSKAHKRAEVTTMMVRMVLEKTEWYLFISETWMKEIEGGTLPPDFNGVENMEGREEAITIVGACPQYTMAISQTFTEEEGEYSFGEEIYSEGVDTIWTPHHWRFKN